MPITNRDLRHCTAILALLVAGCFPGVLAAQGNRGIFRRPVAPVVEEEKVLTAVRVRDSIDRGVNFLKRSQLQDGSWGDFATYEGGVTALVTLAMLNSGIPADDNSLVKSFASLDQIDIESSSVYVVSLMTMVYCYALPETHKGRIRECAEYLTNAQYKNNAGNGGWSYKTRNSNSPDSSNTQFALLALHEAALVGIEIPVPVWTASKQYWERLRDPRNGGFFYAPLLNTASGSMSCAAISSLVIIDENLPQQVRVENGKIQCCGDEDHLELVEGASQWLANNFTVRSNPPPDNEMQQNWLYYLYGMERAARLTGQRFFGTHDWYREGAIHLLDKQTTNGSWLGASNHGEANADISTAYALLFLSKGKRPIVIGKYKHTDDNDWDRHRQGVHYLTRQLEQDWKTTLNWQSIEGSVATADDLLECPVLFISGRDELRLNEDQKKALREYVDYGGFIFAEACQGDGCGDNVPFDQSFRALMDELFPGSKLQLLNENHPVFSSQYTLTQNPDRPLYGLQSSCRTSVIYCPKNLAGFWKHNRSSSLEMLANGPQNEVKLCIQLGANVVAYATGREVKDKLDRPQTMVDTNMGLGPRTVLIPKLSHGGGDDDAPNAWQNIIRRAQFDLGERFRIERHMIRATEEQLAEFPMVFMHGRSAFVWNNEERLALREFLTNRGGFLFADSICSANGFTESFRNELRQIIPDAALQVIPANDPIWSKTNGGYDLQQVGMHRPAAAGGGVEYYRSAPQLEGIQVKGRWVVVFSPNDLSCAMENASPLQCAGYDHDDAARIGVNVILFSLQP